MDEPIDISAPLNEAIADRIASGKSYSNRELARFLTRRTREKWSDVYVGKLRRGEATNPRVNVLLALGEYLDRDPYSFLSSENASDTRVPGVLFRMGRLDPRDRDRILDTVENMLSMLDERDRADLPESDSPGD